MEYELKKPYTLKEKNDFIVKYNHEMGMKIEFTNNGIIAKEIEISHEEILNLLRHKREQECFQIINRGQLWYNKLSSEQVEELDQWYNDWLNVTETKIEPTKPQWLN